MTMVVHPQSTKTAAASGIAIAVIEAIFTVEDDTLKVLLVHRSAPPEADKWALPGGLLGETEAPEATATRKLFEETGVTDVYLEQLYTFSALDSNRRSITVSYFALVHHDRVRLRDSKTWLPAWHAVDQLPLLAFHNEDVLQYARERLQAKLRYTNVAYSLLPTQFTMSRLQSVYEAIAGRPLDKRNFRRKMLSLDIVRPTGSNMREGAHRPAQLYEFTSRTPAVF